MPKNLARVNRKYERSLQLVPEAASVAAILVGVLVIIGWLFNVQVLKSVLPGFIEMKMNAAVAIILSGLALWFSRVRFKSNLIRRLSQACAVAAALIGLLTLMQYVAGWDLHIDQLIISDRHGQPGIPLPGRMSPLSALSFSFLGCALLLLDVEIRHRYRPALWLASIATLLALTGLLGHVYQAYYLYAISPYTGMALHTAVTLLILCLGIFFSRPSGSFYPLLVSETASGIMLRRLIPVAILLPFVLGWFSLIGETRGLFDYRYGLALFVLAIVATLVFLIWQGARAIHRKEIEREQFQQQVAELEGRFFAVSIDMLCLADFDGYFKRLNQAWEQTLGFTLEELLAKPYIEFVHPDDRERTIKEASKIAVGAHAISFENRYLCKDGAYKWLLWNAVPVLDQQIIYAVARDVTEQKQAEEALRASELRFRSVTQSANDAIISADSSGQIISWNQGAQTIFGYTEAEALGQPVQLLMPDRYKEAHCQGIERFAATGEAHVIGRTVEFHGRRKDRTEFPLELSLSSWQTKEGTFFSAIIRDITERRQAQEKQERLVQELQTALAEVKTLHGMLPICSYCKSIRDDQNYWQAIETYISERSEALFSHSICPTCYENVVKPKLNKLRQK